MVDTYSRRCQLGASRHRLEDAIQLCKSRRWTGAVYLGGYAVECSLKALICYNERKANFKETKAFKDKGLRGASLHSLSKLLDQCPSLKRAIEIDRTRQYRKAWDLVTETWRNDELRYSRQLGNESNSAEFIESVKLLHRWILAKQGE